MPPTRRTLVYGLGLVALVLIVGRALADLRVDQLWYAAMGAGPVWREKIIDLALLRGLGFAGGTAFAFANLYAVRRSIVAVAVPTRVGNIEIPAVVPPQRLFWFCVMGAVVLGAALAAPLSGWHRIAMARHGLPFNDGEGVFERDFGFYVYWLPIENAAYLWTLLALTTVGLLVFFLYALTRSLRLEERRFRATTHVRRHLSVLGALVLLLLAWSYRLDAYDLFTTGTGPDGAFVSVDRLVSQRADLALAFLSLLAAVVVLRTGWVGQVRMALVVTTIVIVAAVVGRQLAPMLAGRVDRGPDPLRGERAYLDARAAYSRRAFAVDAFTARAAAADTATRPDVQDAALWDDGRLREWITRTDRDRSITSSLGHMVSDAAGPPTIRTIVVEAPAPAASARRWSVSMIDATLGDERGAPLRATAPLEEPLVAEGATGVRLVDDSSAAAGTSLSGTLSRVSHAWSLRNPGLLFAREGSERQIVLRRDVRQRIEALAPIFAQSPDVRPLLHQGTLYWTLDLYSTSERYPISEAIPFGSEVATYARHAATALVDAATGRVQLVLASSPDPIARSWQQRFPELFVTSAALAPTLAAALPPPIDLAVAQARVLARYGVRAPGDVQPRRVAEGTTPLGSAPVLIDGVIGYMTPLIGADDRIDGLMLAVGGADRGTRWLPLRDGSRWPELLEQARSVALPRDDSTAQRVAPRAPRGVVAPARITLVGARPAAIVPAFGTDAEERPVLERVGVATSPTTAAGGATLADAVRALGGAVIEPVPRRAMTPADARRLYDAMRAALARGDWLRFGAAFDSLGRVLPAVP
ncbi:MAG: UPF0182 family protein [Gemmatimonadaceae bacterium]|nr:UPF0182 family protein [Gemmatimonadaceae bacterium]